MYPKITFSSCKGTSSYHADYSSKKETGYSDLQTLIIEKGTKRIRVRSHSITNKKTQTDKIQKVICNSCNAEIGPNICKVLVMRNKDGEPRVLHHHFFFPCWDFESLSTKYSSFTIDRVGVSIPENILVSKSGMIDLKNNLGYWT